ncbi:MAG: redox-sensing transcriptional repressor Rex [Planctomycetes bacterium]|nr:redox-sensing transcriptional repressor Rex [Planctomycetota bacterium]
MRIPDQTIGRLFLYLRALFCLSEQGIETVSSDTLGEACQVKPAAVRKDLSYFGGFGKRGVGYNVAELIEEIRSILNLDVVREAALVGVGNIGRALLAYRGFEPEGFEIGLAFDSNPEKIGKKLDRVQIEDVGNMEERIQEEGIKLGIIAVPVEEAPDIAHRLADSGVKAILSFAPCPLNMPKDVKVTCMDLATEMARLIYYL